MQRSKLPKLFPALLAAGIVFASSVLVGCPLRRLTGLGCPLCGMSRAFLALLRLDCSAAFGFHPLWPAALFGLPAAWILAHRHPRTARILLWCLGGTALVVYALRLCLHDPIVWPDPAASILGHLMNQ